LFNIKISHSGDKLEKTVMDGACSTYGGKREVCIGFWWGNLRERNHLGDSAVDGRIILRWMFSKWDFGGTDRIKPSLRVP
jgi:hypothetical protein